MTFLIFFAPLLVFGACLIPLVSVLAKLCGACRMEEITPEWFDDFSTSAYHPMEGLLSSEDFSFLSRQPGFDLGLYRKLRRDRLLIFRQYLHRMICDFNRLHVVARFVVANSPEDQSEFLKQLVWLKFRFSLSVVRAECSYFLCRIGFETLPAQPTIARLEEMSVRLRSIHAVRTARVFA